MDAQVAILGQVGVFADAGAGDDPGDVGVAVVIAPMGESAAAVVGGDEDDGLVEQVLMLEFAEDTAEGFVGGVNGFQLGIGTPAVVVACGIDAGKMNEHELGVVGADDGGGAIGQVEVLDAGVGFGDVPPIQRIGLSEGFEFGLAADQGGGEACCFGEFKDGGDLGARGIAIGPVGVGPYAMPGWQDAGEHAGV